MKELIENLRRDSSLKLDGSRGSSKGYVCSHCSGQEDCNCSAYNEALDDVLELCQ
jgi:hypothetical protein